MNLLRPWHHHPWNWGAVWLGLCRVVSGTRPQALDFVEQWLSPRSAPAELQQMSVNLTHDGLLIKLGQAKARAPTAWRLVEVAVDNESAMFIHSLDRNKLR